MTAQQLFALMLKAEIAPALRAMGFRGAGSSYSLPSPIYWALLGFQKNRYSTAEEVAFTVNLKVIPRDVWAGLRLDSPWLGDRPAPNTSYRYPDWEEKFWDERIGFVLPVHDDHWWTLRSETPSDQLAAEVIAAVRDYALPAMQERMNT